MRISHVCILALLVSSTSFAAARVVYEGRAITAVVTNPQVLNTFTVDQSIDSIALNGLSYIISSGYRDSSTGMIHKCTLAVDLAVDNSDGWNPKYYVKTVGSQNCN